MDKIIHLLKEMTVQCLEVLKERFCIVLFTLENFAAFILLITVFGFINAALFGVLPFSETIWWEPVASGLGLFIGIIRGLWDNIVTVPGTMYFHIKVTTHCFLVMAPASAILLTVFFYMGLVQSWFFAIGLFSDNPLDRKFRYFLKQNRLLLLGLLCIVIAIVAYILLYDPTLPSTECPSTQGLVTKSFICLLGTKTSARSNTELSRLFVFSAVQLALYLPIFVYDYFFRCGHPFLSQVTSFLNHLGFQEPASPLMERLIGLDSDIWTIMLFSAGFVLYMIYTILYDICKNNTTVSYKKESLIEIVFYTIPAIIFCLIFVPAYPLLTYLDEIFDLNLSDMLGSNTIHREWYWSDEYGDCDSDSCISMASPNEPNCGWFSSIKNYWGFGKDNQPLPPLETNQKILNTLQKAQDSTLGHCKKHDDLLIEGSLSPRSHDIMSTRRDERYFHYSALSKCVHQVSLDVARTEYNSLPTTLSGSFGNALGQKVGAATEPLYTEMAKNAVTATAESLQSSNS